MRALVTCASAFVVLVGGSAIAAPVYLTQARSVVVNVQDEDVREDAPDFERFETQVTATTSEDFEGFGGAVARHLSVLLDTGVQLEGEFNTRASGEGTGGGGQPATAENNLLVTFRLDLPHTYQARFNAGVDGFPSFPPFSFETTLRRGDETIIDAD